ncbi:MAG: IS110 family transposase [Planctomycetota bacterium]
MSEASFPHPPTTIRKLHDHAAGIDIGAAEHWVCVDPALTPEPIRRFGAFTEDLIALVAWLRSLGVRTVAMEATGVYWRELYTRIEEAGMEARLVDPRKTRNPSGRKTDMQDCRWIWELHAHGLLDGAFVPGPEVQQLRTYLRFRQSRVELAGVALQEMQRALSLMNLKLQHVIADIGGTTGQRIITAILGGERRAVELAKLRDYRCKADEATIAKALTGTWRSEHIFLLRQAHTDYVHHSAAMAVCHQHIDALIQALPARGSDDQELPPKRPSGKNDFSFDAQRAAHRLTGVDLAAVDGIGPNTALSFLGEVGFDLTAWPNSKAFCAWLGLCPNPKRSGGKHLGSLPTSANRAARILRNAAMGLHGKLSPLATFFAKIASRRGRAEAIKAVAHKLARIIYALFRDRSAYDRTKLTPPLTERAKTRLTARIARQAHNLGFQLVPVVLA